jgi:hypothetical protein
MLRRGDDEFSAQEIAPALIDRFHKTLFSLEDRPGYTRSVDRKPTPCHPVTPIGDFSRDAAQSSHQDQSRGYIITVHPKWDWELCDAVDASVLKAFEKRVLSSWVSSHPRPLSSHAFPNGVVSAVEMHCSPSDSCRLAVRLHFQEAAGCAGRREHHSSPAVGPWQGKALLRCRSVLHQVSGRVVQAPSRGMQPRRQCLGCPKREGD